MLVESLIEIRRISQNRFIRRKLHKHYWVHNLPFKIRLHKSHLYISIIPPIFFGAIIGIMSSILGVGGGFLLVPDAQSVKSVVDELNRFRKLTSETRRRSIL